MLISNTEPLSLIKMRALEIEQRIMTGFAEAAARPGDSLSPGFMNSLNISLDREDQERYQQAVTKLLEAGWIDLSGTSLQLTKQGWHHLNGH